MPWPYDTRAGSFLGAPPQVPEVARYDEDADELGYVMNVTRLWGHLPAERGSLRADRRHRGGGRPSQRDRGILITAMSSTLGDSSCSLAWGRKLVAEADADLVVGLLFGGDEGLSTAELALAHWARQVTADPNATTAADLDELRTAGYDDRQIAAITFFVGLRIAFATVNDALGSRPDRALAESVPASYGMP